MRIRGWHVEGFGALRDWRLDDLPGGLNVFYGANEAGKSTLLAFLRFMLFGFRGGNSKQPRYPPPAGFRHGGRLWLSGDPEEEHDGLELMRIASGEAAGRRFRVRHPSGEDADEAALRRALGHVDRELFSNVFAFSLSELQSLDTLSAEGVQDHIFSAGITGAGRSARDALRQIDDEAREIWRPRGKCRTRELADSLARIEGELTQRREEARGYPGLDSQERELAARLASLGEEYESLRSAEQRASKLCGLWHEVWSRIEEVRAELAGCEPIADFPNDARRRHDECSAELVRKRAELKRLFAARAAAEGELESLSPDSSARAVHEDAEALRERLALYESQLEEIARLHQATAAGAERLDEALRNLGPGWQEARLSAFDASIPRSDEAAGWDERLASVVHARREAERSRRAVDEQRQRLIRRLESTIEEREGWQSPDDGVLDARGRALRRLRAGILERSGLQDELVARRELLAAHRRSERRRAGQRAILGIAVAAAAGIFLLFSWPELPSTPAELHGLLELEALQQLEARLGPIPGGSPALLLVAAGLLLLLLTGGLGLALLSRRLPRVRRSSRSVGALAGLYRQLAAAGERKQALHDELVAAATSAGLCEIPEISECEDAEAELDRAREVGRTWKRYDEQARGMQHELAELSLEGEALAEAAQQARARVEEVESGWSDWKRSAGLPETLAPSSVPHFFDAVRRARELVEARDATRHELVELEASIVAWQDAVGAVLVRAGESLPARGSEPAALREALNQLCRRCREALRREERRSDLVAALGELEQEIQPVRGRVALAEQSLAELLELGGAKTSEDFLQRLDAWSHRRGLEDEIRRLERDLDRRLGRGDEADGYRAELLRASVTDWERDALRAREVATVVQASRDEVVRQHQDVRGRLAGLEESVGVGELELQRAELRQEMQDVVARWRRLQVASGLIERTLERFERERQPAVLQEASHHLERVTAGRYRGIVQSAQLGGLSVIDASGEARRPGELSRGTAEQLYVCIRLGLIAEFARRSSRLPVVMDDVLVNFDDARAGAMCRVLADFAHRSSTQLLFFTCSSRTRRLLEEAAPNAPIWQLPGLSSGVDRGSGR